ncbi:MAG: DegT/DnrJ/EryC1/StrS family aminotransferase, partial [Lachnospiraceae bacterium]|nr:DegT/DnrJ/EryC1/StrS family aminotransferase [Lachnospiraceae bacterium]
YTWVNLGSSYLPGDMNAAYLWAQLEMADEINEKRRSLFDMYDEQLAPLAERGLIECPQIPDGCVGNGHMYYIKVKDIEERTELIRFLDEHEIMAVFHYIPLHTAPAGKQFGTFFGEDRYTTKESERLLRLPMYFELTPEEVLEITGKVKEFYRV